ncbi:urease accessory protein UreD [Clostridium manihotivorum]|uniref:Urease accessory protein UreD n=1 Tax=Clostridium manihotivorum TaxID=2320868 RepID=A0A410DZ49_9CLOT|nr:urease accessory protein UreD [Clostridium manihotivorum]QAA34346.1 urease accessory protein UreD [Clostridium manihotivorum]
MNNNYYKDSHINIETSVKKDKTVLERSYFTAPFKIISPFYEDEHNMMKLCVMNVSPGILEGDRYYLDFKLKEGSRLHLYSQSYSKVFNMKEGNAYQKLHIELEKNSRFEYFLMPTVPYSGSNFFSEAEIHMESGSELIFREILSCGRYMSGERFDFSLYSSKTKIYHEGKLMFFDNTFLEPNTQNLDEIGYYEGYTHQANVYIINNRIDETFRTSLVEYLECQKNILAGLSKNCENMLTVRILGNSSDALSKITDRIREIDLSR